MFNGCSAINSIDVAFTGWASSLCATSNWLNNVSVTGTFNCPAALGTDANIERGASNCPAGWTVTNN